MRSHSLFLGALAFLLFCFACSDEVPEPEPALPPPDERSWYEKVWDFVTGKEFQPDE